MNDSDLATAGTVLFPFLRSLAHDMAAPLTSTLGYAQLNLEAPGSAEEVRDDLLQIEQSAQSMREQLGRLSRLSRYIPKDTVSPARELVSDLQTLSTSLAMSEGHRLEWTLNGDIHEEQIHGNPWLLRTICLAFLGAVCSLPEATVTVARQEEAMSISFPPLEETDESIAPNTWGCPALGQRLLKHNAGLHLRKSEESWSLRLPVCT